MSKRKTNGVEDIDPDTLDYGNIVVDPEINIEFGDSDGEPVVLDGYTNKVLRGQMKVAVAAFLGWTTVRCIREW